MVHIPAEGRVAPLKLAATSTRPDISFRNSLEIMGLDYALAGPIIHGDEMPSGASR